MPHSVLIKRRIWVYCVYFIPVLDSVEYSHTLPKKLDAEYIFYSPTIVWLCASFIELWRFWKRKKSCIRQEGNLFGTQRQTMRVPFLCIALCYVQLTTSHEYLLVVFNFYCVCWHFHQRVRDDVINVNVLSAIVVGWIFHFVMLKG